MQHPPTFPRDGICNNTDENWLVFVLGAVSGPERVLGRGRTTQLGRSREGGIAEALPLCGSVGSAACGSWPWSSFCSCNVLRMPWKEAPGPKQVDLVACGSVKACLSS